jgi:D-alanyl-lipoteichoic acid acyltransferase DltB (MBOAT superfamily)
VSFFPLLVAGPIERATHLLPQIKSPRFFDSGLATNGLKQIVWGLFKKVVIADACAVIANDAFAHAADGDSATLLFGAIMFSFQIYGDFSGYSDIALGTAKLFGIRLLKNFSFPYFSRDIAEFWRRWHISLSSWFRDYLYIPLGGSKLGKLISIRNTFIIFLVSGFWHGASWNFIIWGLYFCILLIGEKLFINQLLNKAHIVIKHFYALFFIIIGWAIFYFTDLAKLSDFLGLLFGTNGFFLNDIEVITVVKENILWLLVALLFSTPFYSYFLIKIESNKSKLLNINYLIPFFNIVMLFSSIAVLVNKTYNPFIYFRFYFNYYKFTLSKAGY